VEERLIITGESNQFIIIIIIIINEEIIVAFSPRTTGTRYRVKKTKPRDTSCLAV